MDSARVRDASNGQAFFNGTVVPFVRLPVPGDRIALPQVVEVVVGVPPAQHREVLRSLEDPGDGDTRFRGVVDRGGRGAPGEALQLEVTARVENVERL